MGNVKKLLLGSQKVSAKRNKNIQGDKFQMGQTETNILKGV